MFCTRCGQSSTSLSLDDNGNQVCLYCKNSDYKHKTYNKKAFLLPDSIHSMSCFHAKIFDDATYVFRIHDCKTSIRLHGDLKSKQEAWDAVNKLHTLEDGLREYREFILKNYTEVEP